MTRNDEILIQAAATVLAGYYARGYCTETNPEDLREMAITEAQKIIWSVNLRNERKR